MSATLTHDSDDRSAQIVADYQSGLSGPDVARKHHVSRRTVYRTLHAAGVPRRQQWSASALRPLRAQRAARERQDQAAQIAEAVAGCRRARSGRRHVAPHPRPLDGADAAASSRSAVATPVHDQQGTTSDQTKARMPHGRAQETKVIRALPGHWLMRIRALHGGPVATRRSMR
ncbi:helix-turn-helix domain-containing protein [Actinocatenispora comari]|uniref:Uncharacterized protein n=1 Tax=Actinocatenispora comari TaxID=2807577 RepID=A0A8J4AM96_9ACTN|nr:hypothetical protein NUM_73110 [Actinocatenispora comari]